jgi:glycosyltransferase involved in cell wall biosynthesis
MKLSIIIPVLDSHLALRRQLLHMERDGLPPDTEFILVDDGSDPPIENTSSLPITIQRTGDTRPWTWALARNVGARMAQGQYLLMFDLDHIVTRKLLDFVVTTDYPKVQFKRELAVLDERGVLTQDRDILESYGLPRKARLRLESHHNSFAMRRDLFWELGGYREDLIGREYPQGEDSDFWRKWEAYRDLQNIVLPEHPPTLYVFPNGRWCGDVDYDSHKLFHNLSRKTNRNYWWHQQQKGALNAVR